MRYTVATGEPVVTGFMRTRPGKTFWAWFYAVLYFLQIGWPAWAATAAGAIFFLFAGPARGAARGFGDYLPDRHRHVPRLRGRAAARQTHRAHARDAQLGAGGLHPRRLPGAGLDLRAARAPGPRRWRDSSASIPRTARSAFMPGQRRHPAAGRAGGLFGRRRRAQPHAVELGARQGLRHGQPRRPHRAARVGGEKSRLADTGFIFEPDAANMRRWRGWWRIVRVDQWGIFFVGALLGMMLPALLYVTFVAPGTDIKGLAISAVLAQTIGASRGAVAGPAGRGARRVDPVQDPARLRRRHDALDHRHPVDRQRARARLARRRRARRLLQRCSRWSWSGESSRSSSRSP